MEKKIVIVSTEQIAIDMAYWKQKFDEECNKPKHDKDSFYLGLYQGHMNALNGLLNKYAVEHN